MPTSQWDLSTATWRRARSAGRSAAGGVRGLRILTTNAAASGAATPLGFGTEPRTPTPYVPSWLSIAGTRIRIFLPRLAGWQDGAEQTVEPGDYRAAPQETVLVVEDDDGVRAYTVDVVKELGYRVLQARDGLAAIELLQNDENGAIDLLFTDVVLPGGVNGQQLAQQARQLRPKLKVLFATGYARDAIVHDGKLDPGVQLINKPFSYNDLAAKLRRVIDTEG